MIESVLKRIDGLDRELERIPSLHSLQTRSRATDEAEADIEDLLASVEDREDLSSRRIRSLYDRLSSATRPKAINKTWKEIDQEEDEHRRFVSLRTHVKDCQLTLFRLRCSELNPEHLQRLIAKLSKIALAEA